jgi:hypothetical protein
VFSSMQKGKNGTKYGADNLLQVYGFSNNYLCLSAGSSEQESDHLNHKEKQKTAF